MLRTLPSSFGDARKTYFLGYQIRSFSNFLFPLLGNEAQSNTFLIEISLFLQFKKTYFHMKGFDQRLVLKLKKKATWKWLFEEL